MFHQRFPEICRIFTKQENLRQLLTLFKRTAMTGICTRVQTESCIILHMSLFKSNHLQYCTWVQTESSTILHMSPNRIIYNIAHESKPNYLQYCTWVSSALTDQYGLLSELSTYWDRFSVKYIVPEVKLSKIFNAGNLIKVKHQTRCNANLK